jgi:nucleotidyltransferase substrate binding protein (TIGR01987 family)
MSERKLQDSLGNLERAIKKLRSALEIKPDRELVMEGTIQRFEVVVELVWKTLKRAVEFEGYAPKGPKDSMRDAFSAGWLHDEEFWLDMLDHRNTTSHRYLDEEIIENNYQAIHAAFPQLDALTNLLRSRYPSSQ